jgi:hypothetical protein
VTVCSGGTEKRVRGMVGGSAVAMPLWGRIG